MRLLIVRHAKAFERDPARWPDDSLRPLTKEGRKSFARMAARLPRWLSAPEKVFASAWSRAADTAAILAAEAEWPAAERSEFLESEEEARAFAGLLDLLRANGELGSMALVGHEPTLGRFASLLLTGRAEGLRIDFRKGAMMELEVNPEGPVGASLVSLSYPGAFSKKRRKSAR